MPRINLLPARKIARQEELRAELRSLCYIGVGVCLGIVTHAWAQGAQIERKQQALVEATAAGERAAGRLKELDELKAGLGLLGKKLAIIDELEAKKHGPSMLLGTFAEVLTNHPKVWLSKLEQSGEVVKLAGFAMAQEDISGFQAELSQKRPTIADVTLLLVSSGKDKEIEAAQALEWTMTCRAPTPQAKGAKAAVGGLGAGKEGPPK